MSPFIGPSESDSSAESHIFAMFPVLPIPVGRPTIGFGHSEQPKMLIRSSCSPLCFSLEG